MHLNREQAKLILSCHTWEEDSQGEDLEAALALLETDPELAEWFEAEKKWDQTISKELANSPIPNGLLGDVTRAYERGLEDRQARSTKQRMLSGLLIAGTFGLLVVGVVGFFLKPYFIDGNGHHTVVVEAAMEQDSFRATPQTFASFRQEITDYVADRFALSNYESDYPAMESWVTAHGGASLGALPAAILRSRGIGCNVVTWSGGTCSP